MNDKPSFTEENVLAYMRSIVSEHLDTCNEVNMTSLAEAAADHFDMADEGGPLDEETHWIWDKAFEVSQEHEDGKDEDSGNGVYSEGEPDE